MRSRLSRSQTWAWMERTTSKVGLSRRSRLGSRFGGRLVEIDAGKRTREQSSAEVSCAVGLLCGLSLRQR